MDEESIALIQSLLAQVDAITTHRTRHEKLRWAVCHRDHGWLNEYRDGKATWGGPMSAALFSDERAAEAVACKLLGYTVATFRESDAEVTA